MNNSLVTVVVPVYNVEKYLDRCIDSIVNQTYKNLEIILVDDGSPDNCPQMCDAWAGRDNRIKVIHKQNTGAGMARNTGIENSCGEYILFVDSDDFIDVKTIEKCIQKIKNTQSDIVMFGRYTAFADGKMKETPIVTDKYFFSGTAILKDILPGLFIHERGIGISSCNKIFKSSLIKENNLKFKSEREILSEDAIFHLELFKFVNTVTIIPESFYYYFENENSFSKSYKRDLQRYNNNFLETCLDICKQYDDDNHLKNCVIARYHIYAFAGMKQIEASESFGQDKKRMLNDFFNDKILHKSITLGSLKPKSLPLKMFFLCIKFKLYWICRILLKLAL